MHVVQRFVESCRLVVVEILRPLLGWRAKCRLWLPTSLHLDALLPLCENSRNVFECSRMSMGRRERFEGSDLPVGDDMMML
jgi:hypothetical protein